MPMTKIRYEKQTRKKTKIPSHILFRVAITTQKSTKNNSTTEATWEHNALALAENDDDSKEYQMKMESKREREREWNEKLNKRIR